MFHGFRNHEIHEIHETHERSSLVLVGIFAHSMDNDVALISSGGHYKVSGIAMPLHSEQRHSAWGTTRYYTGTSLPTSFQLTGQRNENMEPFIIDHVYP